MAALKAKQEDLARVINQTNKSKLYGENAQQVER